MPLVSFDDLFLPLQDLKSLRFVLLESILGSSVQIYDKNYEGHVLEYDDFAFLLLRLYLGDCRELVALEDRRVCDNVLNVIDFMDRRQ